MASTREGQWSACSAPLDRPPVSALRLGRRKLTSSAGAGSDEIREMLEFSAKHDVYPEVEMIRPDYLNTALERLETNDVRFRLVMDVKKGI